MYYNSNNLCGVLISIDAYKELLNARRKEIEKNFCWTIPDIVWEHYMQFLDEMDGELFGDPDKNDPSYVVDNIAVNGQYGDFDDFKEDGETDEDFIAREEDNCLAIYPEERFIIYCY